METVKNNDAYFDPTTQIYLTPSYHGELCKGNGVDPNTECCCDECDYYLVCFPDWKAYRGE